MIFFFRCFGSLSLGVELGVVPNISVDMHPSISFIDRFIRVKFSFGEKGVSYHYHPKAILSIHEEQQQHPAVSQEATLIGESTPTVRAVKLSILVRIAPKHVPEPRTQHIVLSKASTSSMHTIKSKTLEKSDQVMSAAYGAIDTYP